MSNETFVQTWEASNSVQEVATKLNLKIGSVQAKASKLRVQGGIPLKSMRHGNNGRPKTDYSALLSVLAVARNTTVEEVQADAKVQEAIRVSRKVAKQGV